MNTIKGGSLEFEITANAGKLSDVLEETKRRIQGFSDATAAGGEDMEKAFKQAAATIESAWRDIDAMSDIHKAALADLQKQYAQVGKAAGEAFMRGTADGDKEYRQLIKQQDAIGQQISQRQKLIGEINETADALLKEEANFEKVRDKADKNSNSQAKLTTQLRNMQYELAAMEEAGQRGSEGYAKLRDEAARLTNALGDARTQAKILAHDNAGLQGVISGVSGLTGAFSAAQGAVALFSGESENLQKIMLRVQSLMGITIGLQQVANTLNKDSAFRLVTIAKAQEWWNTVKAKALIATTADTAATAANTTAKTTNTTATAAATAANIGLAGAFRLVGAAITSIPGIGWILAGVTALVAVVAKMTKETREAKKQQKEMNQAIAEIAGKPLASIQQLSKAYSKLGDDLKAKEKFIDENRDKFDQLGVAVNSVKDAENLLITNKQAFIESQIMKAKAMAATELAAKKYQEALEKAMTVQEPNKYRGTGADRGKTFDTGSLIQQFGRSQSADSLLAAGKIEINPAWEEYNKKVERSFADANKLFEQAAQFSLKEKQILEQIGQSLENITAGSITALENNITKLNEKYKLAKTDDAREALAQEIQEQQALLEKIDVLQKTGGTTTKSGGDPFLEILEARKKKYQEYYKWVNSGDQIVRKAAEQEFAGLLTEGATYLEYLKNQRDKLTAAIGDDAATQRQQEELRKLNAAIATETKDTVLAQFEADLQAQLATAENVMQMLDIIQQRRQEIAGDSTDLGSGKSDILDKAQQDAAQQAEDQTRELLDQYTDYLQEKIAFEANYAENSRLLNAQLAKAKTEEERRIARAALAGLEADRIKYANQTGSKEYDLMVEQYRSFEQRRTDIAAEYDRKIAEATRNNNAQLAEQLATERDKSLSRVALEELQNSDAWTQLLGNLDDLTTEQLNRLIQQIEAQRATLGVELDPADLQTILDKIEAARDIVRERNPFKALAQAVKDYGKEVEGQSRKKDLNRIFESAAASIDLVKGAFDSVVGGLTEMGMAGDEVTQKLLGDISELIGSAGTLAKGLVSGNPMAIIQGGIGVITGAFKVFNKQDRDAERALIKHANAVQALEKGYRDLERAVDKALGESVYKSQQALISNMQQQRYHLQQMWMAEERKKRSNKDKIEGYKEQYEKLGYQIEDTIASIAESITQTSAKDLAGQLADTIAEAFTQGFDSANVAKAIEEVTNNVLKNAVKNALKLRFLEQPMQDAVKQLQKAMGFDESGAGAFDGLTPQEQQAFKDRVKGIASTYSEAMKMYEDLFKDMEREAGGDPSTSLAGAIKGASQESIDLLAGQTNAVRIQQAHSIDLLRDQLIHLASIDGKIGISNELLSNIYNSLRTQEASDPLRAQGITL
jgi:uncharacterized protein YifE (UPF0438 family)